MSPEDEGLKKLLQSAPKTLIDEIKSEAPALVAMVAGRGYELWDAWAKATEQALRDNAVVAETLAEREEARLNWLALRRFRSIPPMLADMARTLDSSFDPVPGSGEVDEAPQGSS
jgi:hypothetical protein